MRRREVRARDGGPACGSRYNSRLVPEYLIRQYGLQQGALEIQYIEEYFLDFPRKKLASEVIERLSGRDHQILMAEAPLPDDPGTIVPVSFKVAHELRANEPDPKLADLVMQLEDVVTFDGRRVLYQWIGGTRKEHSSVAADRVRAELRAASGGDAVTILLSHRPDTVLGLPPSAGIDLTVAGHTHGRQIAVPGFGPLTTLSNVPRRVGAGGLHEVAGNRIYVSTGVGMERGQAPQLRFFVPPSVAVLELTG